MIIDFSSKNTPGFQYFLIQNGRKREMILIMWDNMINIWLVFLQMHLISHKLIQRKNSLILKAQWFYRTYISLGKALLMITMLYVHWFQMPNNWWPLNSIDQVNFFQIVVHLLWIFMESHQISWFPWETCLTTTIPQMCYRNIILTQKRWCTGHKLTYPLVVKFISLMGLISLQILSSWTMDFS